MAVGNDDEDCMYTQPPEPYFVKESLTYTPIEYTVKKDFISKKFTNIIVFRRISIRSINPTDRG